MWKEGVNSWHINETWWKKRSWLCTKLSSFSFFPFKGNYRHTVSLWHMWLQFYNIESSEAVKQWIKHKEDNIPEQIGSWVPKQLCGDLFCEWMGHWKRNIHPLVNKFVKEKPEKIYNTKFLHFPPLKHISHNILSHPMSFLFYNFCKQQFCHPYVVNIWFPQGCHLFTL